MAQGGRGGRKRRRAEDEEEGAELMLPNDHLYCKDYSKHSVAHEEEDATRCVLLAEEKEKEEASSIERGLSIGKHICP